MRDNDGSIDYSGPAWDISSEYTSPDAPEIQNDLDQASQLLDEVSSINANIAPCIARLDRLNQEERTQLINSARRVYVLLEEAAKLIYDPATYANCLLSVNALDKDAEKLEGRLQAYRVRMRELREPTSQFEILASQDMVDEYLDDDHTRAATFIVNHNRKQRHEVLSLEEENVVSALRPAGIDAWGTLYSKLSGALECEVKDDNEMRTVGLAEAASLTQSVDDTVREDAWRAINKSWSEHEITCTAAINSIAGWRLEMCRRRSTTEDVHYLDAPIHANHFDRQTLEAVMDVAAQCKPLAQRAANAMARAYRKSKIGPWDQRAPAPQLGNERVLLPFKESVDIVANAYGEVDRSMHDFIRMMAENAWIEGTVGPNKQPGAYCTSFDKSNTPRVYMTYSGSMTDVTILAHELGHAFHHWVMRDLPESQKSYGMSLAETASTFGETLVRDALTTRADSPEQEIAVSWEELNAIVSFLLNIPTRFSFERKFYDAREKGPVSTEELKHFMAESWIEWYGDSLSEPDDLFWINKLHFYISGLSFYNFPYLFGYLFSQAIYQRRNSLNGTFFDRYRKLLRDTGRMSAEDLASNHLDADITQPEFWLDTVNALEPRVARFEEVLSNLSL